MVSRPENGSRRIRTTTGTTAPHRGDCREQLPRLSRQRSGVLLENRTEDVRVRACRLGASASTQWVCQFNTHQATDEYQRLS